MRLGGPKQTALFALLALTPGRVVSTERIIDGLWGEAPPDTAAATVQGFVSKLRKALAAAAPGGEAAIVTRSPGYLLESAMVQTDADNPGQWMLHCHNTYHLESGMATEVPYVSR